MATAAITDHLQEGAPPHWLVYFGTDDLEAIGAAKISELGGTVVQPPMDIGEGNRIARRAGPRRAGSSRSIPGTSTTD